MVPGIGSAAVEAGCGVTAELDALPQLAAEAEGSEGTNGRYGAGDRGKGRRAEGEWCSLGPGKRVLITHRKVK